jgi:post-segregation antitoxin (ccd killing protein)
MSEKVTIEISEADLAELREWARNSELSLEALLQEAVARYMERTRQWIQELREADKSPSYTLEEVKAHLAERRSHYRGEAAE